MTINFYTLIYIRNSENVTKMSEKKVLKVGSRKSQLALIQTELVVEQLQKEFPDKSFEIVTMMTTGDKILDKPLPKIGEKSLFTKELETALETNEVDFVVHSLKDLPTVLPSKLTIGAVLEREDPRDALILNSKLKFKNLKSLPKSSVIGTSSLRRCAQLLRNFPNIEVENIRGNLNTRLRKLDDENNRYSGIILAAAGVKRMKLENRITELLESNEFLYAVGQGALAVECCSDNDAILEILQVLNHSYTILRVVAERSFLKTLGGGCSAPVAVSSSLTDDTLSLVGAVWNLDGSKYLKKHQALKLEIREPAKKIAHKGSKAHVGITAINVLESDLEAAESLGIQLAKELIKMGALGIIDEAKSVNEKQEDFSLESTSKNGTTNNSKEEAVLGS